MDLKPKPNFPAFSLPVAIGITIGVAVVSVFVVLVFPIRDNINNAETLRVELIVGIIIASSIYGLQFKSSKDTEKTIKKIDNATEEIRKVAHKQDSIYRSITIYSLGGIYTFFQLTEKDLRANLKSVEKLSDNPQSQLDYINELLSYKNAQNSIYLSSLRIIKEQLGRVENFIPAELYNEIRNILDRMKVLSGTGEFKITFEDSRVESWVGICKDTLDEITKTNQKILQMLKDEIQQG